MIASSSPITGVTPEKGDAAEGFAVIEMAAWSACMRGLLMLGMMD